MGKYAERAKELFMKGYNCSQAVACAFTELTGQDEETMARLSSSFGGGLGRMREVCGAVSGAAMVLGLQKGFSDPKDAEAKKEHYKLIRQFAARFKEENGSVICRELLSGVPVTPGGDPEERTPEFYKKRPCAELVYLAAEITEELLA